MRLRTDIYVSAVIRRVFSSGGYAAVVKKGAEEAGAVFVRRRGRNGLESLYGPAPQTMFGDDERPDRLFEIRVDEAEPQQVDDIVDRELKWDGDLWVVEIETDSIGDLLPLSSAGPGQ